MNPCTYLLNLKTYKKKSFSSTFYYKMFRVPTNFFNCYENIATQQKFVRTLEKTMWFLLNLPIRTCAPYFVVIAFRYQQTVYLSS